MLAAGIGEEAERGVLGGRCGDTKVGQGSSWVAMREARGEAGQALMRKGAVEVALALRLRCGWTGLVCGRKVIR